MIGTIMYRVTYGVYDDDYGGWSVSVYKTEYVVVRETESFIWLLPDHVQIPTLPMPLSELTVSYRSDYLIKQGKNSKVKKCWPTKEEALESARIRARRWRWHLHRDLERANAAIRRLEND